MGLFDTISNALSGGNNAKASAATNSATAQFQNLQTPDVSQMQLQLEELIQQGVLTPEQAQAYLVQQSDMNNIETDPSLFKAQMDALTGLQDISGNEGLTAADRAQLGQIQTQEDSAERGAREAILQNAQARGMGGSGIELLQQFQNQQDSATRKSQKDMDVAAMAQNRALQALQMGGQLGGQIQAQQFGQKAQIADANDAINKFNAQNQQSVGLANTQAKNAAMAQNLAEKQRVADANTATRNQQQQYNKSLQQQDFENKYKKAGGVSSGLQNQAQGYQQAGQATQQLIGSALGAGATIAKSDERSKTDIEDFDPSQFLDDLTSVKYRYKNPADGDGKYAGPMAQDLEKNEIGKSMVHDTPDGKVVDTGRAAMTGLSVMSDLHERLKKLEKERA